MNRIGLRLVIAFSMIVVLLLSACSPAATETTSQPSVVRIGWAGSPDTLNPGVGVLSEAYTIYGLVYDTLYSLELDGSFKPLLVESATPNTDYSAWTLKIHSGVTWHDGKPLTAKDVAFTLNYYRDQEDFPFMPSYTTYFDTITATDDQTVELVLTEAIPNLESQFVFLYVLPEHIWSSHQEDATEFENLEMIGSGPFQLAEYKPNEFVRLKANKGHFMNAPKVDEIIFQTFENQDALVQAVRTGQVDMITEMPNTAVAALKEDPGVQLAIGQPLSPDISDIIFNQVSEENCPRDAGGECTGHPALRDRNVRLALAHATDKKKIIDVALLGFGEPGLTLVAKGLGSWYNSQLVDYAFDVDLANKILDDAGYTDANNDGIRDMPAADGNEARPLTFRLSWPSDSTTAPRVAELLDEMWSQIGIKLEPQALDPDTLTSVCCPTFDFDIIIWGWGSDPDPGFMLSIYLSSEIESGLSETGYANAAYDELFAKQATSMDPNERKNVVWEMQKIVFEDVVYIIPFYAQAVQAYRTDKFTGWLVDKPKVGLEDRTNLVVIEPVGTP